MIRIASSNFCQWFCVSWIEIRCVWLKQSQLNFLLYRQFGELFYVSWSVNKINPQFKDQQIENFDHWRILMVWFNDVKWTKFLFFINFIATQKDHIRRKLNNNNKKNYMWNQYHYFDLQKIRLGQACTTKKLSCLCLMTTLFFCVWWVITFVCR